MATAKALEALLDAFYERYPNQYNLAYAEAQRQRPQLNPSTARVMAVIADTFKEEFKTISSKFSSAVKKSHGRINW